MENTILIIENDVVLMGIYKEILELYDYDVHTASNGVEGVEKFKQLKPALVIMEVDMRRIDGLDAFKKIKEIDKNANVIIVTTDLEFELKNQEGYNQGPDKVILKPILVKELLNLAKKYVKIRLEKRLDYTDDVMLELTLKTDKFFKNLNEKLTSN